MRKQNSIGYLALYTITACMLSCAHQRVESTPEGTALAFYENYVAHEYLQTTHDRPSKRIDADGHGYLDTTNYFQFLRSKNVFSPLYFDGERTRIERCNLLFADVDSTVLADYASPWEEIPECGFMNFSMGLGCSGDEVFGMQLISVERPSAQEAIVVLEAINCGRIQVHMSLSLEGAWLIDSVRYT